MTRHISLAGLDASEVAQFIERTIDVAAPESLVAAVHGKTEGNPLYVVR